MLENPSALVFLLLLLPVIILYLLKPKPEIFRIPSLMLLTLPGKKKKLRSLFEKLIRDPLLLLQLAIITILVLSLVNPYLSANVPYENTVIVLDNSASMAASDVSPDRFTQAVDIASGYIGKRTSLILAGSTPILLFKDADSIKAAGELKGQRCGSTGTGLNNAMLMASQLLDGMEGKIVVISDFGGQDITYAQKTIEAKKIPVDYRQVGIGGSNAGIVDAAVGSSSIKLKVKNYDAAAKAVVVKQDNGISFTKSIQPGSVEFFDIPAHAGKNTISLEPRDDLSVDNFLYVSMPGILKKRVLLLSDKVGKTSVSAAFHSIPDVEVDEAALMRAPRKPDHSMVVLYDYTKDGLLPGTMDDLRSFVEGGGTLVFVAAEDLPSMDTKGLLPVEVSGRAEPSGFEVAGTDLTEGLELGVSGYLKATLKEGAVALASAPEGPVLAYRHTGRGRVVYLGMNDRWGDFHLQASYPIFWYRLLGSSFPASEELNFKTGTVLPLGTSMTVSAPRSTIETGDLYLGESGFYGFGGRTIAANLLDEKESDITVVKTGDAKTEKTTGTNLEKMYFDVLLSILAVILLALELYYLKYRGNI